MIIKQSVPKEKEHDYTPNIQGKGYELIEKVKDMQVEELTKKRKTNSNSWISANSNKISEKT